MTMLALSMLRKEGHGRICSRFTTGLWLLLCRVLRFWYSIFLGKSLRMLKAYIRRDVISFPNLFYCLPGGRGGGDGELQIQPCEHLENEMH